MVGLAHHRTLRLSLVALLTAVSSAVPGATEATAGPPAPAAHVFQDDSAAAAEEPPVGAPTISLSEGETETAVGLTPTEDTAWMETDVVETPEFGTTGIRWETGQPVAIEVRTRDAGGRWSGWTPLDAIEGAETGGPQPNASEPLWAGSGSTAVQYRLMGTFTTPTVVVIPSVSESADEGGTLSPNSTTTTENGVVVNLRDTWDDGCRDPDAEVGYSDINVMVVHHTAASNTYTAADVPSIIRGHCHYHVDSLGWDDIAYNFLVDKFGQVWEGRAGGIDLPVRGAHSQGFNTLSSGVALMGSHESSQPTSAALTTVGKIVGWKLWLEGLPATGSVEVTSKGSAKWPAGTVVTLNRVSGHRDVQVTTCPGDAAYDDLPGIRTTAAAEIASLPKPSGFVVGDFTGNGFDDAAEFDSGFYVTTNSTTDVLWADYATESGWATHMTGDFNGDGKDDIASFHPSNGTWWIAVSTGSSFAVQLWADYSTNSGWSAHRVGDFDGDGKDDIASFHPSNGTWWIARSNGSGFTLSLWADYSTAAGWSSHVVGDFNGDGKDDIASFHPSNGTWWVARSNGTKVTLSLWLDYFTATGWHTHIADDFNGDGKEDIASFHPSNGTWWVAVSNGTGFTSTLWADYVTPEWTMHISGDFDGDGRSDVANYFAGNRTWWVGLSDGTEFTTTNWAEIPRTPALAAAGARDGDGSDDLYTVTHPGLWIFYRSTGSDFEVPTG